MLHRALKSACLSAVFLCLAAACRADRWATPEGVVQLSRPAISLNVWAEGNSRIAAVAMTINGVEVPARYSLPDRLLQYTPPQTLPPGNYTVMCRVMLSTGQAGEKQWQFSIAADAVAELPEPTAEQVSAFNAANVFRRKIGLPEYHLNKNLCAAAQSHCRYIHLNKGGEAHNQTAGKTGFTGVNPSARAAAFLFRRGCGECINYGTTPEQATIGLVAAPYHRGPFQEPGSIEVGVGHLTGTTVFDFAGDNTPGITVYPLPGQTDVPLRWGGGESPDPWRLHGVIGKGYVVSLRSYGAGSKLRVRGTRLATESGKEIFCYINTPANDDRLPNGVFLMPKEALAPGTTYVVTIKATREDGADASREWRFITIERPPHLTLLSQVEARERDGKQVWAITLVNRSNEETGALNLYYLDAAGQETRLSVASIAARDSARMEAVSSARIVSGRVVAVYKEADYTTQTVTLKPEQQKSPKPAPKPTPRRHQKK